MAQLSLLSLEGRQGQHGSPLCGSTATDANAWQVHSGHREHTYLFP